MLFVRLGVLPFLLLIARHRLHAAVGQVPQRRRTSSMSRASRSISTMVAMGQMLALLTGGFDLSVGTIARDHLGGRRRWRWRPGAAYPDAVGAGHRARHAGRRRRRPHGRRRQRHRRRGVRRLALHDDAGRCLDRLRHRAVPHRRRAGLRHAAGLRRPPSASASGSASRRRSMSPSSLSPSCTCCSTGRGWAAISTRSAAISRRRSCRASTPRVYLFVAYVLCAR